MHWKSERLTICHCRAGFWGKMYANTKWVLILGPLEHTNGTVVLGAADNVLQYQKIIFNGPCTINAIASLLRVLDGAFGDLVGDMTTIHC